VRIRSHFGWAGVKCDLSTPRYAGGANVYGSARRSGGRDVSTEHRYQSEFRQPDTALTYYIYRIHGLESGVRKSKSQS
jgi:hypothetical protein